MTNREAAKIILSSLRSELTGEILIPARMADDFLDAICISIFSLMKQEEVEGKRCKCKNDA